MVNNSTNSSKLVINGSEYVLRLSLGALAEIEEEFQLESISALGTLFSESLKIGNLLKLLKSLLVGGGNPLSLEEIKASDIEIADLAEAITKCVGGSEKK